ncbi:MAG: hypothetical protein OEV93_01825 [Candidatus Moranbacteria bacterium]|nr:hypothetical protein [Candidatus Moranbacteria bacterium]
MIALDSRCIPEDVCEIEQRASEFLEYVCSEFGQAGNAEKPSWLTGVEGEEVEEEGGEDHSFFTGDNDEGRIIPFPESSQIDNRDGDEAEVPHLRSLGDGDL